MRFRPKQRLAVCPRRLCATHSPHPGNCIGHGTSLGQVLSACKPEFREDCFSRGRLPPNIHSSVLPLTGMDEKIRIAGREFTWG
jgi:hypothetical protein